MQRRSGVLLPIFSLPGPEPVGTFGRRALEFVDFLQSAGFSLWQILPVPPEGLLESPYAGKSAFAIDPYLMALEDLEREGFLQASELGSAMESAPRGEEGGSRVPWVEMRAWKAPYLALAASRVPDDALQAWLDEHPWAGSWALWSAIGRDQGRPWTQWPAQLRDRVPQALEQARRELHLDWREAAALQWLADRQWSALKAALRERDVLLLGDIPLYVAGDGVDVWENRELFELDPHGEPIRIAGCPPDPFSEEGQRWGNPVFNWDHSRKTGHAWWRARFRRSLELADLIRIDHFRGFEAFWSFEPDGVPKEGRWNPGPGRELFDALRLELAQILGAPAERAGELELPVVAEDLGIITPEVERLRDDLRIPGMKVLQFAWDGDSKNPYYPPGIQGSRWLVCTGTHDLDSCRAWYRETFHWCRENFDRFTGHQGQDPAGTLVRLTLESVGELAVVPLQDLLGLDSESRINVPGVISPRNWSWRAPMPGPELAARYRAINEACARIPRPSLQR